MNALKARIMDLEQQVEELRSIVLYGKPPAPPGVEDYRRAVLAAVEDGNMDKLSMYLRRGGRIPKAETVFPEAAERSCRNLKRGALSVLNGQPQPGAGGVEGHAGERDVLAQA